MTVQVMLRQTHLIEEYKVKDNTILCCCLWFGSADDFAEHQLTSEPTDLIPSPDPYEAVNYFTTEQDKKRLAAMLRDPSYFDYVQED